MNPETITRQQYYSVIGECRDLFLKKAADYGTSWSILRLPSLTDQIYIKAERTRSIQQTGLNKVGESMEGEFVGIINYCVIALVLIEIRDELNNVFPESLKEIKVLSEKYDEKVLEAFTTMEKKNHDYGEAWRNMRVSSFTDLILMKILRLKQIEDNQGKTIVSEGEGANYIDILNYAVFALIQQSEKNG